MTAKPCLTCGEPSPESYCSEHRADALTPQPSPSARGYGSRWERLSKRARALQPFCSDCGTTDDLTTDHSRQAWERVARGLAVRLRDVAVVCRSCNGRRGRQRPETQGESPSAGGQVPGGKARSRLQLRTVRNSEEGGAR